MMIFLGALTSSVEALDSSSACPGSKVFIEMGQGIVFSGNNKVTGTSNASNPDSLGALSIPAETELGETGSANWPWYDSAADGEGEPVERLGYLVNPSAVNNSNSCGLGYNVYGTLGYDAKIGCTLLGVFAGGGYLGSGTNISIPASAAIFDVADETVYGDGDEDFGHFPATATLPVNYNLRMRTTGYVTVGLRLGYIFNKNVAGVHAAWVGLSTKAGLTGPSLTKNTVSANNNESQTAIGVAPVSRFNSGVNLGVFFERMISQNLTLGVAMNFFLMGKKTYNFAGQNINWAPNTADTSMSFTKRLTACSFAVTAKYTLPMSR